MHSPAIIQIGPPAKQQAAAGAAASQSIRLDTVAGPRPQSAEADRGLWIHERWGTAARPRFQRFSAWARMVLPQPAESGQMWAMMSGVLADYLVVLINFAAVAWLQAGIGHHVSGLAATRGFPVGFVLLYAALVTLLAHAEGLYGSELICEARQERLAVLRSVLWATLLAAVLVRLLDGSVASAHAVTAVAVLTGGGMLAWRHWQRQRIAAQTRAGQAPRNVLIVGAGRTGRGVAACLEHNPQLGRSVRGFLDEEREGDPEVLGGVDDLGRVARAEFADEIILAAPRDPRFTRRIIQEACRIHLEVKLVPELPGFARRPRLQTLGRLPAIALHEEPIPALGLLGKRALDVAGALFGLVVTAPLLFLIALLIRLESPGPVLYGAPRAGRRGRSFRCYKFRTMRSDADQLKETLRGQNHRQGPFFKMPSDPRITRLGRWLRRYSLDEVPQLWNVVKGEMSLVGPRPHPLDDVARYQLDELQRLDVTPGITGLWQVTARRDPSFERNLELDREYVEHWSLWLDLRILFKTVQAVLQGSGT